MDQKIVTNTSNYRILALKNRKANKQKIEVKNSNTGIITNKEEILITGLGISIGKLIRLAAIRT